jgi:hypothetical protein
MMVPRIIFEVAKPQKSMIKLQLGMIPGMNNDILSSLIA